MPDNDYDLLPDDNNADDFIEIKNEHKETDNFNKYAANNEKESKDVEILKNLPKIVQSNKVNESMVSVDKKLWSCKKCRKKYCKNFVFKVGS